MQKPFYLRQLRKDLEIWIEKDWVKAEHRDDILATAGTGAQARSLVPILMVIGALLVGLAFVSFIAANWSGMEKLPRLVLLFGALWSAFTLAIWSRARSPFALEGFVLLGTLLFGVNIMFVAQTYNISAHYPDGIMFWAAGALVAALFVPSRAALALGFSLAALATFQEFARVDSALHLKFILLWVPLAATALYLNWRPGHHLAALSLMVWLFFKVSYLAGTLGFDYIDVVLVYASASALAITCGVMLTPPTQRDTVLFLYGLLMVLGFSFALLFDDKHAAGQDALMISAACAAVTGGLSLFALLKGHLRRLDATFIVALAVSIPMLSYFQAEDSQTTFWLKNAGYLGLVIWALSFGAWRHSKPVINLALIALGAEILFIYFSTFGGLLGNAAFFGTSGLVFMLSAFGLEKLRRNLNATDKASDQGDKQ